MSEFLCMVCCAVAGALALVPTAGGHCILREIIGQFVGLQNLEAGKGEGEIRDTRCRTFWIVGWLSIDVGELCLGMGFFF